jgi:dolichol-phosphate hexosyltransferase
MNYNGKNILDATKRIASDTMDTVDPALKDLLTFPFIERRVSDRRKNRANLKKITILIPCYNEEKGIGKVIDSVPDKKLADLGYKAEVIVIDNNSTDNTIAAALDKGSMVISEKKQGKGNAIRTGFRNVSSDTEYVIMLDGDDTYKSKEIPRLIEPLENGFCDVVVGSRLEGKLNGDSLSFSHRLANWFFTFLVRRLYFVTTTDICTGYFAWKKEVINELSPHLESNGFAIEAEMITKMARLGFKIFSVPITYDKREGDSKLSPYLDGIKITWMLLKNTIWSPLEDEKVIPVKPNTFVQYELKKDSFPNT